MQLSNVTYRAVYRQPKGAEGLVVTSHEIKVMTKYNLHSEYWFGS